MNEYQELLVYSIAAIVSIFGIISAYQIPFTGSFSVNQMTIVRIIFFLIFIFSISEVLDALI